MDDDVVAADEYNLFLRMCGILDDDDDNNDFIRSMTKNKRTASHNSMGNVNIYIVENKLKTIHLTNSHLHSNSFLS